MLAINTSCTAKLNTKKELKMKFALLLWALSWKMYQKSKTKASVREHIGDKHIVFQLQTESGWLCRNFTVANQSITSKWGQHKAPTINIIFADAAYGAQVLTSEAKRLAFMQGVQDKKIVVEGDLSLFMWYVELGSLLNN